MKKILVLLLIINVISFAESKFLNNSGIVDIGRTIPTTEVEVPKEYVETEPQLTNVPNAIVYSDRLHSELYNCEVDFLGTRTCPLSQNDCPSFEEFTESTSVPNLVKKSFNQICTNRNDIKKDGKCYYDPLGDNSMTVKIEDTGVFPSINVIDTVSEESKFRLVTMKSNNKIYFTGKFSENTNSESGELYYDIANDIFVGNYLYYHVNNNGTMETVSINADGKCIKLNNTSKICFDRTTLKWGGYSGEKYETFRTYLHANDDGELYVQEGKELTTIDTISFEGSCPAGQVWVSGGYCTNACPTGYVQEGTFNGIGDEIKCHKPTTCPNNTVLQENGSCLMEYTWYSYTCPTDVNEHGNSWHVIESGKDCGNTTCVNSPTPPPNNCVRPNYTCPLDPNQKCGKTVASEVTCGDGYVWNVNRCERIEKYCGEYTYNSTKDICEKYRHYDKICNDPNDIYDVTLDKCVSNTLICKDGAFDTTTKTCVMDFKGTCANEGFFYDKVKDKCINPDLQVCMDEGYEFDKSKGYCVGEMNMCLSDEMFNPSTNRCEKKKCGSLATMNSNNRCETVLLCNGTLTHGGTKCIPNILQ